MAGVKKKALRQQRILEILEGVPEMRISELAAQVGRTAETIRSDLVPLVNNGLVQKEHGKVRLVSGISELPNSIRTRTNVREKRLAAVKAMELVREGDFIFLDGASTLLEGIPALALKKDITVATNSLPGALELMQRNVNTIMVGGCILNLGERTYGSFATDQIDKMQFDIAFMGTDGCLGSIGFTSITENDVSIKRHLLGRATKIVVVTDHTKFDMRGPFTYCRYSEADVLVTDRLTAEQRKMVEGVREVICAEM